MLPNVCSWVVFSALAAGRGSPPPPTPADTGNYRVVKVADGVYTFIAPDGITPMVAGNSTVVIGRDGVLVVDTGQFPSVARWEIGRIKKLTGKPVRWVVTTHWHPDHWVGNGAFRAAYPGAEFIATEATDSAMRTLGQPFIDPKVLTRTRDALDRMLAAGTAGGKALDEDTRAWYRFAADEARALLPDLEGLEVAYPTAHVATERTIDLGGRTAEVRFLGRGNTAGDLVVFVPDAKVVVTGDLIVHPYPYSFGSFLSEWTTTLERIGALGATAIVPGHGAVERDRTYLDQVIELLGFVRREAAARAKDGRSLEETTPAIDLGRYVGSMCHDNSYCRYGVKSSLDAMIGRAYREAKEGPLADEK